MSKIVENAILIYTDGSLYRKGLKGGYGFLFVYVDLVGNETELGTHAPPGIAGTTGNRMELQACVDALSLASEQQHFTSINQVVLRTDSQYVSKHYLSALSYWPKAKWRNASGRPIENADLWREFAREFRKIRKRVTVEWIKGHGKGRAKDPYNVRADKLAKESATSPLSRRVFRSSARRKLSTAQTKIGSVTMRGQTMEIRIIEVQYMKTQRVWKFRYEIRSAGADFGKVDLIFYTEHLRDGHTFEVRVNDDTSNPRIVEILREIEVPKTEPIT